MVDTQRQQRELNQRLFELACDALAEGNRFSFTREMVSSTEEVQALVVRLTQKLGCNVRANSAHGLIIVYDEDAPEGLGITMVGVKK